MIDENRSLISFSLMEEQRTIEKFYVRLGKSIEEVTNDLVKVYEENAMAPRTIRKWVKRFKEGRQSTEDDQREGRPSTSTIKNQIEEVQRMVNDDPKIMIRTILRELNISLGSVISILHENLNMTEGQCEMGTAISDYVASPNKNRALQPFHQHVQPQSRTFHLENCNRG